MSVRLTNKQHFLYWAKRVRNYRGSKEDTIKLYKEYLLKLKENSSRRPRASDFFPTTTCRKLEHYLERFWTEDDARKELIRVQGGRMDDPIKKDSSVKKMLETFKNKPLEERLRINKSCACYFKDPFKMAERYNVSPEEGEAMFKERKVRIINSRKKTLESMGGFKKEWSHWRYEYWMTKGFDEESAKLKAISIHSDTRSVSGIMARHNLSEEEALKFFNDVTEKGRKTFEARPQHEKDEILLKRTRFNKKYSMASAKFFQKLLNMVRLSDDVEVRLNDDEYFLWDYDDKKVYFYDFCIPVLNIMIEYNGIMFHPRQKDTMFVKVEDSVKKDDIKDKLAAKNNFKLFWFWEHIDDENEKLKFYAEEIRKTYEEYNNTRNTNRA